MSILSILEVAASAAGVLALAGIGVAFFGEWARFEITGTTR